MHEINKTLIVRYCICVKHFLASELIINYSGNVVAVRKSMKVETAQNFSLRCDMIQTTDELNKDRPT